MQSLLLFHMARDRMPDEQTNRRCFAEMTAFVAELKRSGSLVFDSQVLPDRHAVRVTRSNGATDVRTGPFEETPETLGGFFIVRTDSLESAVELAARCPHTMVGPVELRPLNETSENAFLGGVER